MINLIWLTIALPIVGVLFNGLLGRRAGHRVVSLVGPLMVLGAFLMGVGAFFELSGRGGEAVTVPLWTWATIGDFNVSINLLADPLSLLMVLIVTGVGFLIHVYATDYMIHRDDHGHAHPDRDFARFFTFLNLFIASMLVLVLGDNYLMMYVGWELVGLCSYLLIGFWYDRKDEPQAPIDLGPGVEPVKLSPLLSPAASGMKAFIVNRVGDVGFALGVFLIWSTFGTLQFLGESGVFAQAPQVAETTPQIIAWITLLLFIGAMGKSAQIPLFVWLPDAMAGPTPVSALIHAATMVTAGVYMIVRSNALYSLAPGVSMFVAIIGAATALFAATIALVQVDLKRVLAYSTVSQLGYMFMAVGVGAYTSGMFHLTTHAFFKALLFLAAGSVMHALHDVIDIRRMGGLKDKMKITWLTFWIGGLALAGFPLMSGFFSKDEILAKAFEASPILWVVGIVTAALTAFYTFRAIFIAFHGQPRDHHLYEHAHESHAPITFALIVLAVLSIIGGLLGLPTFMGLPNWLEGWLEPIFAAAEHAGEAEHHLSLATEWTLFSTSAVVSVLSIALAYFFYVVRPSIPQNLARSTRPIFSLLANKYYVDEIYNALIVKPALLLAEGLAVGCDKLLIDGVLVDGLAKGIGWVGSMASHLQSGYLRHYALATFIGVLVLVSYFFLR
ncbi:MAG: NADH-quinone oxidoreductase subunit L [Anaerolineae bacterium]|nr:NADH-quinone oxidoreductase subunit L [Anaerolineales bacterium]MCQ3973626.1 NADH-quinone oxidoreductase subunit L [Anaerolineae bacterium]